MPDAFDPLIAKVRPYSGHSHSAAAILKLLAGSKLIGSDQRKVQDAYSLRCIPQVHGATCNALEYVHSILQVEINSVNDNPMLLPEEDRILSGGNFHGQPVAQAMDFMVIAVAELASIAERLLREAVSFLEQDEGRYPLINKAIGLVTDGQLVQRVEAEVGTI